MRFKDKWEGRPLARSIPVHCKVKARHRPIRYPKRTYGSWWKADQESVVSLCGNDGRVLTGLQRKSATSRPREWVIPLPPALASLRLKYSLLDFGLPIGEIVCQLKYWWPAGSRDGLLSWGLKHMVYEESLRELSLFRLEKRWLRRNWLQSDHLRGDCKTLLRQVKQRPRWQSRVGAREIMLDIRKKHLNNKSS